MRNLLILIVFALSLACADKANGPQTKSVPPSATSLTLGVGDVISIRVFGEEELSGEYRVENDGTINFPLLGRIALKDLTASQAEKELEARLADGYLRNPQVSVEATQINSMRISVLGQVKNPGTFPYRSNMNIVEALTLAGGFTPMAKKNSVRVTRQSKGKQSYINVAAEDISRGKVPNFYLHPGDLIFVPERLF